MASLDGFVSDLASSDIGRTFNLFRDEIPGHDAGGGAALRCSNLRHYLDDRAGADVIAVGEAPSFRGMRWSGIAFTSERTLDSWGEPYRRTSLRPEGWTEPSATIVHRVLAELRAEERVLLWNAVPTHPHRPGNLLSNRRPSASEIEAGGDFARRLLELVQPPSVVAIGRVAESILRSILGTDVPYVRHPANAGAAEFASGLRVLLA
jgi:uracil-DNA glycosylase